MKKLSKKFYQRWFATIVVTLVADLATLWEAIQLFRIIKLIVSGQAAWHHGAAAVALVPMLAGSVLLLKEIFPIVVKRSQKWYDNTIAFNWDRVYWFDNVTAALTVVLMVAFAYVLGKYMLRTFPAGLDIACAHTAYSVECGTSWNWASRDAAYVEYTKTVAKYIRSTDPVVAAYAARNGFIKFIEFFGSIAVQCVLVTEIMGIVAKRFRYTCCYIRDKKLEHFSAREMHRN